MIIRQATAADIPALLELAAHFRERTTYQKFVAWRPEQIARLIPRVLDVGVILLAEDGDQALGMLALAVLEHPYTGELVADELVWWVEPHARNRSIGPRLLRGGEAWARAKGATILSMVAPVGSSVGAYYERLGYTPVETRHHKVL